METQEAQNFFKAWGIVLASLVYCYLIASKIPKGLFRFFSLLPIFSLYTILPLSLSRPLSSLLLSGFITWLANFKLILYSFNQGPLSEPDPQKSLIRFILFAALPIKIQDKNAQFYRVLPLNLGSKSFLFALFNWVYLQTKSLVVFCCLMYLFIDVAFGVCDLVVGATLGLELDPPSDEPYLSTSLQDFWGRRWNRMISDALRRTIYLPVKSMATKFVGKRWAPIVAVMATFVASGLMHELTYYYVTRVNPTWEVTWFFVLHGVCVVLEMMLKRALGPKWRLHWAVSGPLTVGFVTAAGYWLFFPQVLRNNVDTKGTEDVMAIAKFSKEMIRGWWFQLMSKIH